MCVCNYSTLTVMHIIWLELWAGSVCLIIMPCRACRRRIVHLDQTYPNFCNSNNTKSHDNVLYICTIVSEAFNCEYMWSFSIKPQLYCNTQTCNCTCEIRRYSSRKKHSNQRLIYLGYLHKHKYTHTNTHTIHSKLLSPTKHKHTQT